MVIGHICVWGHRARVKSSPTQEHGSCRGGCSVRFFVKAMRGVAAGSLVFFVVPGATSNSDVVFDREVYAWRAWGLQPADTRLKL